MKPFNLWFILGLITIFGMTCASQWKPTTSYTATSDSIYKQLKDRKLPTDSIKLEDILLHTDSDGTMYFDTEKRKTYTDLLAIALCIIMDICLIWVSIMS